MSLKIGILMDAIETIHIKKDTTFAMMLEAQARDFILYYMQRQNIWLQDGLVWGLMQRIEVQDDPDNWYQLDEPFVQPLLELNVLLLRKDPPFDMNYVHLTYLLEQAQSRGLLVINNPKSIRDANEKLYTTWFPQCCPKTLVTSQHEILKEFILNEEKVVIKPLGGMGGLSVFRVFAEDLNLPVIIDTVTHQGTQMVMAQRYIEAIDEGDKRVILINGEPFPYALARIPAAGDFRGNLVQGARAEGRELTDRDLWLCEQVGPSLQEKGLIFVGLDIIGDYLTEINVTSPTCAREIEAIFKVNVCAPLFDWIEDSSP